MKSQQGMWIAFMLLFAGNVAAQDLTGRLGLGGYGAMVKMIGGECDRSTVDQMIGVRLIYGYTPIIAFEAITGFGYVYPREEGSWFQPSGGFTTLLLPVQLNAIFHLHPSRKFRPYVIGGGGLTHWNIRKTKGAGIFNVGSSLSGAQYNATLSSGFGLEFFLNRDIVGDLGLRYHRLLNQKLDTSGMGDDANDGIIELRFTFTYFWGGFRDTDGDGIEDKLDLDKYQPEDFDGFKDDDGLPDFDNDEDGIPDELDKAPDKPEDKDGFQDDDGIPDPDNDGDGIPDLKDRCPFDTEDKDGFNDDDGCPEHDNDGDGIPDSTDQCPNWPEDFNDYMDHDGCPDEKPEPPPIKEGEKIVLKGVNFTPNSASLTLDSYATLNEAVKNLLEHEEIVVEIRGYTDNIGDFRQNEILSEKRAKAVMLYLLSKGIAPQRLTAVGFGERDPIAPNTTKQGRTLNRRIEFIRIK